MKYKLLVLDVDGTLLNNQKEISPRTLAALLKVQQMGVHIVLASGRPTNGVMPIAEKLELNHYGGYILSYNGGSSTCRPVNYYSRSASIRNGSPISKRKQRKTTLPSSPITKTSS